jgi:oxygen-dependent protoporphyrinogen oxidase
VDQLVKNLNGDLRLCSRVRFIDRHADGYRIWLSNGEILHGDAVVLATLANVAAGLLQDISPEAGRHLGRIRHNHIGTVSLVYRESDLPHLEINGLMIPRRERRAIDAVTFTSRKMPQRSSPGYTLLRVFIGGGTPEIVEYDDESLMMLVRGELSSLLGIHAEPQTYRIFRWPNGFPQAEVGHLDRIDEIEKLLPEGIALAGSSYRGIAIPDCIRQGRTAVQKLTENRSHRVAESSVVEFS